MAFHPRENRGAGPDRRTFLKGSAGLALGAAAGSSLLAACGGASTGSGGNAGAAASNGLELSRPDHPVTLPLFDDVPAIQSGLKPETGTLRLFNYSEYNGPDVLKAFGKKYGVKVQVTTFTTMDEAVAKLRTGGTPFDVFFPTPDILEKVVKGKLLQPLNKSYIPNLANVWDQFQSPFYDVGAQYTVPYTVYTTGIMYRTDHVTSTPSGATGGYDLLWDPAYKGKAYILDDSREPIAMAMVRKGETDVNTEDPAIVDAAAADLQQLISLVNVKVGISGYQLVPEGDAWVHEAWSGDAVNGQYYLPKGTDVSVLGYWFPPGGGGVIGSDTMAVCKGAQNPVLAHLFLDFMLDPKNALDNFGYTGYQPPQKSISPDSLVTDEYIAPNLKTAVVRPADYDDNYQILQLSPAGVNVWNDAWSKFKSGA